MPQIVIDSTIRCIFGLKTCLGSYSATTWQAHLSKRGSALESLVRNYSLCPNNTFNHCYLKYFSIILFDFYGLHPTPFTPDCAMPTTNIISPYRT